MVGLNSEMGRELFWRGFPAPICDATYFDRFWDARARPAAGRTSCRDRRLGRPPARRPPPTAGAATERFVLLVRSELLRRYPERA